MSPLGITPLKSREGVRLKAYLDSVGVPTTGYGHIKGVKLGDVITRAQADAFFLEDLASQALPILSAIKVSVAEHERDALISIVFNIGGGFTKSTFLKPAERGRSQGLRRGDHDIGQAEGDYVAWAGRAGSVPGALHGGRTEGPEHGPKPGSAPLSPLTPVDEAPLTIELPAAGPVFAPAPRNPGRVALPPLSAPTIAPAAPSLGSRLLSWLCRPWFG